jgi:hypothetical protein
MLVLKDQQKVGELSAGLVRISKDVRMKKNYEHAISLSSNECVSLNTSLGRKYHPILEGDNGGNVGTWKSNHKGPNVDANEWLSCD